MKKHILRHVIALLNGIFLSAACSNAQPIGSEFRKHTLSTHFKSEGITVADVNKDGKLDVIAGPEWFEAPSWKVHGIYESKAYNPAKEYCSSFLNITLDINFDGWEDLIVIGFPGEPGHWYENPMNKSGYWKEHVFLPAVGIGNESPAFVDMDGDGRLDILCTDSKAGQIAWLQAPVTKGDTTWKRYPISKVDPVVHKKFSHGIGYGDLNKDGKKDIFTKIGWWEAPADPKQPFWSFHPVNISEDCSQMHAFDVNSDGLMDIISASAHKRGIWWHRQSKDAAGEITFTKGEISDLFTQSHASSLNDINGDGQPDLVSGKRFFAHNDTNIDPGTHDPAVLYWFQYTGKQPYFIPHLIDDNSGAGLHIVAKDINKDNRTDIVIANKKGVYYFENTMNKKKN